MKTIVERVYDGVKAILEADLPYAFNKIEYYEMDAPNASFKPYFDKYMLEIVNKTIHLKFGTLVDNIRPNGIQSQKWYKNAVELVKSVGVKKAADFSKNNVTLTHTVSFEKLNKAVNTPSDAFTVDDAFALYGGFQSAIYLELENQGYLKILYDRYYHPFYVNYQAGFEKYKSMRGYSIPTPQRKRAASKKRVPAVRVNVRKMF